MLVEGAGCELQTCVRLHGLPSSKYIMCVRFGNFQPGDIVTGKIIKLEPTGVLVDFSGDRLAYVPLLELSLTELQAPEEALQLNELREFLVVGNYDGKHDIFFSHCSPETLIDSDRLYEAALDSAGLQSGRSVNREDLIVHTKILATHAGGVSARIQWFLCSEENPPTVSFSIRQLERQKAWERVGQLQSEDATVYGKIYRKIMRGAFVEIEGLRGFIHTYVDRHQEELTVGAELPLKILEVREECDRLVLISCSVSSKLRQLQVGQVVSGTVRSIKDYGAVVDIGDLPAWLPISNMILAPSIDHPSQVFKVNDQLKATIVELDIKKGTVSIMVRLG